MSEKYCSGCGKERNTDDFCWKNKAKSIRRSLCRFCSAEASRKHYEDNKQTYIRRAKGRNIRVYEENRTRLYEYLSAHPCVDCNCADPRVLEFDHVHGSKIDAVTRLLSKRLCWSTIEAEIAKCEVRCANCHRIKTSERGGFWRNLFDL